MNGGATALIGAQYGSEGKGMVAAALAESYDCHVRVGGPNAGHTFYHDGEKFVARSVPCGWINPQARLFIGPGAMLDFDLLKEELDTIEASGYSDVRERLVVDYRATLITHAQRMAEGGVDGQAHQKIGSTGEGVGLARMAKINRDSLIPNGQAPFMHVSAEAESASFAAEGIALGDVSQELFLRMQKGDEVLLEGTQGCGLSLTLGPWPYCTSADTNAAQLASDAGISPSLVRETILVARTFPIRVAGNSGPLAGETSWEEIGQPEEVTTVTRKVRRVGRWNPEQIALSVQVNYPAMLVITFADYLHPSVSGVVNWRALPDEVLAWVESVQEQTGAQVIGIGTGPLSYCPIRPRAEMAVA